ncbi:CLUMA_CG007967, isoform A [Clunio marinus]|uniref:CLUMA_CG007967, isoform A n=1 Tax=Clunio marinus TaxID=568069 RepID=A0A1J1I4E9_9DIPT|nr:CLUMA_CG007967, isoform A [Clunio marinus]
MNEITKVIDDRCQPAWNEVVKKKKQAPVVVLVPKDRTKNRNDTKSSVKSLIKESDLSVNKMSSAANGGLIIECDDEDKCEKVLSAVNKSMGKEYLIQKPNNRQPRIKILKIRNPIENDDELLNDLKKHNSCLKFESCMMEVVKREQVKSKGNIIVGVFNIVIQVNGETYNQIMQEKRLVADWESYKIVDNIYIRRCYQCFGFNHNVSTCQHKPVCNVCASEDHKKANCESLKETCINCIKINEKLNLKLNVNHSVWSNECAVYKRKVEVSKRGINYVD